MAPPDRRRALATGAALVLALGALAGCAGEPAPTPSAGPSESSSPASELAGTTWTGTDSDGDAWTLELEPDGTVAWTFEFDPQGLAEVTTGATEADTWSHDGDTVRIHLEFDDGPVDFTGAYAGLDAPIDATGGYDGGEFTLTLTRV